MEVTLRALYEPGRLARLRAGVGSSESADTWRTYLDTLYALAGSKLVR